MPGTQMSQAEAGLRVAAMRRGVDVSLHGSEPAPLPTRAPLAPLTRLVLLKCGRVQLSLALLSLRLYPSLAQRRLFCSYYLGSPRGKAGPALHGTPKKNLQRESGAQRERPEEQKSPLCLFVRGPSWTTSSPRRRRRQKGVYKYIRKRE